MNKIKCIIVDDEDEAIDRLKSLLKNFDNINVVDWETNTERAITSIVNNEPNIVFIDVEMPRQNGFEIIDVVRKQKVNPTFVFVTGYNQYAIKAIRTAAFDFLLKPVDIDDLSECIKRYRQNLTNKKEISPSLINKYSLSQREVEIIELLIEGKTSRQIADTLFISKNTVDTHRRNIIEKTDLHSTTELAYLFLNNLE